MADRVSLVTAEYAFAQSSRQLGTRDAFLAHLAEDAILFRPRPVSGKAWLLSQPVRPGLLTWYPGSADLSRAGDLGCTTGPWEFRPARPDDAPIAFGYFVSMWRVQSNGEWKVELDCGISCPPPRAPIEPVPLTAVNELYLGETSVPDLDDVRRSISAVEQTLSDAGDQTRLTAAYLGYCTADTRVFRHNAWPYLGCEPIETYWLATKGHHSWQPTAIQLSRSGDLSYVYGSVQFRPRGVRGSIEACYLRVWKRRGDDWRILIDVECPIEDA